MTKNLDTHFNSKSLYVAAGLLSIEIVGLWFLLQGNLPIPKSVLVDYHFVVGLVVAYAAAEAAARASRTHRFDLPATVAFLIVLIVFNPFYPLLLTTVDAIFFDAVTVPLFAWYARRLAAEAHA